MSHALRVVAAATAAVAAGAAVGGWAFGYGPLEPAARPAASAPAIPTGTATVVRATITASAEDPGTVGYGGTFTVYDAVPGTITWLPAPGTVIRPGQRLFAVNGQDTVLLAGPEPAWRPFTPGIADGADVAELQRNLIALGYDRRHQITVGNGYDWATQAAVQRWQAAQGLPLAQQDGQIPLGQVVFLPAPIRVATPSAGIGAAATPGAAVLTVTSTRPVVDVALPADQESLVRPGQHVTITLPDGAGTPGRVLSIGPSASPGQGQGPSPGSPSGGSQPATPATVNVVIGVDHPAAASGLDQAAVQVAIVTQTQPDALVAPISALLAKPGGGFQVTVVQRRTRRNVPVQTGLFDEAAGVVAISGPGITDGTKVQVPSP
jgi:hypothetical protein